MIRTLLLSLPLTLLACTPPEVGCRVGADCATGVCRSDGTCAPGPDGGAGGGAAGGTGGGTAGGTGGGGTGGGSAGGTGTGGGTAGGAGGGIGPSCLPNNDGVITRAEMPLGAGLHATFRVATNATFNSAGTPADAGFSWDFTVALAGDKAVLVDTQPLAGKWFESKFAGATYAVPLSTAADSLLGVFEVAPDGLLLRGVVSPTDSISATELTYTPPAKLLGFPMSAGSSWTTTSTVAGRLSGGIWTQTEKYESLVDKTGQAATPFAQFPVLRVKTVLTRTVGLIGTVSRSYLFATECFGTVATINSNSGESQSEFSSAAEVRRLSP